MKRVVKNLESPIIYEVSVRNFSQEGTLKKLTEKLDYIRDTGVDILWLMPIFEGSKSDRKGEEGSPYAISDHRKIDERYGAEEDLKELIKEAHILGLKVIMDMVFHHTSSDSFLIKEHPEWYLKDVKGKPTRKFKEWSDICDFDYRASEELWDYNIETMKKWREFGIDGFRCDIVTLMPMEFWKKAKSILGNVVWVGEIFENSFVKTLREYGMEIYSAPEMHAVFDISYDYDSYEYLKNYFSGKGTLNDYISYINMQSILYPAKAIKLRFLENHDQPRAAYMISNINKLKNWTTLMFLLKGATLIQAGQEIALDLSVDMFNKKEICWENGNKEFYDFFRYIIKISKDIKERCNKFKIEILLDGIVKIDWRGKNEHYMAILNLDDKFGEVEVNLDVSGIEVLNRKKIEIKNFLKISKEPLIIKCQQPII